MRKMLILLALAILTASSTGCTRCRNLFRRGAPCGGTALAAPAMLGGAIPLGNPVSVPQIAPQIVQPTVIGQPNCCCEQAPMCVPCNPCPTNCEPCCESGGYIGGATHYMGGDCECQTAPGEYFGGYVEGSEVPAGSVLPQGSGTFPQPTN